MTPVSSSFPGRLFVLAYASLVCSVLAGCGSATINNAIAENERVSNLQEEKSGEVNNEDSDADNDELSLEKIVKTDEQWRQQLDDEQFNVARKHGTERAFTGEYWDNKKPGVYECVCCGLPLFDSETKFESGTGWPSFWKPIDSRYVGEKRDVGFLMVRTEVHCARCEGHLGHVFNDGPADKTGLRYCLNSAALDFEPRTEAEQDQDEE